MDTQAVRCSHRSQNRSKKNDPRCREGTSTPHTSFDHPTHFMKRTIPNQIVNCCQNARAANFICCPRSLGILSLRPHSMPSRTRETLTSCWSMLHAVRCINVYTTPVV